MATGYKTGGRQKGTPNKRTQELAERMDELGCDPAAALIGIAQDPDTSRELRARIFGDLLPFLYPRRKAVELEGNRIPQIILTGFIRPKKKPEDSE
jgi:hypothetical protein